ncbi:MULTISPECIES: hypothetical protein [Bacillus]|uniref:hypothetical protein n=1 Tax=Bacillus TaxID=1386 RepID=UPI000700A112|nr:MULTISPECIES: hypothetical protein [Bacillus]KQU09007.1 hypothetical protein ASG46_14840 [Bacillus sp. Leaf49]MCY7622026.1 hypothetical protein [Bacillus altitudinis]MED0852381.1 hypothetical protein [Bacillus altitudinis]WEZ69884.1 hypothetical protein P5623_11685 [Bacillus altitudinis]
MSRYEKEIKNRLIFLLGKDSNRLNFIEELSNVGDLLFFGGSIRDICLFPDNPPLPRDFDIAIKFKDKTNFDLITKKYSNRRNRFGGFKFKIGNMEFDIWDLENTWAFKNTNLQASEENLAKSVYLNIDGIVYNFNKSKLYDELFRTSIKASKLDVNLEENPQVELNLLRALVFKDKYKEEYKLNFSSNLKRVFKKHLADESVELVENLYNLQCTHYKKDHLSKEKIKYELQHI